MVVRGQLLLVDRLHLHNLVALVVSVQRHACLFPPVRDGGDHGADAGPARREVEERGADGKAPSGVRARDRDWWARIVGGTPLCRRALPEAPLGRYLRRSV